MRLASNDHFCHTVDIMACIRKMIVILNSMVRDGVYWDPK